MTTGLILRLPWRTLVGRGALNGSVSQARGLAGHGRCKPLLQPADVDRIRTCRAVNHIELNPLRHLQRAMALD